MALYGRRAAAGAVLTAAAAACAAGAGSAGASPEASPAAAPAIEQLVVFRDGSAVGRRVRASGLRVRVGRKRCAVGTATPLAALVRSRPGRIGLRDYASCSLRPADGGGLYVRSIRGDRGRGQNGWIYKVGNRQASAGAGDPAGPFGRGRLRRGQRVTWFYCRYRRGCQRTLAIRAQSPTPGTLTVRVRGYDDDGKGVVVQGVKVSAGGRAALSDASGNAVLTVAPGRHVVRATKAGLVRSFGERITVRG